MSVGIFFDRVSGRASRTLKKKEAKRNDTEANKPAIRKVENEVEVDNSPFCASISCKIRLS